MRSSGFLLAALLSLACAGETQAVFGGQLQQPPVKPVAETQPESAPPPATVPAEKPRLDRAAIAQLETGFESRLNSLDPNSPFTLMGACSGVYLSGYGMVFVAPLDLINTPQVILFQSTVSKAQISAVHARKVAHLAPLRQVMRDMIVTAARSPIQLAPDDRIVLAVRLYYLDWEDRTGLPNQIVMMADRPSALAGNIRTEEQ